MIEKTICISTSLGARPAALFVQTASKFKSSIQVQSENKVVNAKSIMGIISLSILEGQNITIVSQGEDEEQAVSTLEQFLNNI